MAIFKCKMCGGQLEIIENSTVCTCEYCGTEQTVPKLNSDRKTSLYDRANHFRRNNDYDKAMGIYEQILNEDTTDAESYWSLVLCKYGIEYVEDPATHKRVPTVNRAQYTSIYTDEDYKAAIANADSLQKSIYEQEAKQIDEIQKGILAISEKEDPFDVFICYKETDANGRRTQDSVLANDLYHQLTQEGFKVFFSKITLEDKLGTAYEPYIFAALNSAKVMVVLGTKAEYFNAVWVKNEWSRYLALIKQGAKKTLVPAYRDMDPYDLPEEFSHLQAQDMAKLGFMQDLIRGIEKIIGADQPQTVTKETVVVQQGGINNSNVLIKRGNMALEDGDWQRADDFFEEVLNQDAECAEAYLGKFCAKIKVSGPDKISEYYNNKYQIAEKEKLVACEPDLEAINTSVKENVIEGFLSENDIKILFDYDRSYLSELRFRKEQRQLIEAEITSEKLFVRAKEYASHETLKKIDNALILIFNEYESRIKHTLESDNKCIANVQENYREFVKQTIVKAKRLNKEAEAKRHSIYLGYITLYENASKIDELENVRDKFELLGEYEESKRFVKECTEKIYEINDKLARKKRRYIIGSVVGLMVIALFSFASIEINNCYFIPNSEYNEAIKKMESGDYENAITSFKNIGEFKDSKEQIAKCEELITNEKYTYACKIMQEGEYDLAIELFTEIADLGDSKGKINECKRLILENKYNTACTMVENEEYEQAIVEFEKIEYFKDSAEKILYCNDKVANRKYNEVLQFIDQAKYEADYLKAIEQLEEFGDYLDAKQQVEKCRELLLESQYNRGLILKNTKSYESAIAIFIELGEYKDSKVQLEKCCYDSLKDAKSSGDKCFFGIDYEHNSWQVLNRTGNKLLLLNSDVMRVGDFSQNLNSYIWIQSPMYLWLNGEYKDISFSDTERGLIVGEVSILSYEEAKKYDHALLSVFNDDHKESFLKTKNKKGGFMSYGRFMQIRENADYSICGVQPVISIDLSLLKIE